MDAKHLNEIFDRLGRMEGKQDLILSHQDNQNKRLGTVEKRQNHMMGWGAGVAAVWTLIISYVKLGG